MQSKMPDQDLKGDQLDLMGELPMAMSKGNSP